MLSLRDAIASGNALRATVLAWRMVTIGNRMIAYRGRTRCMIRCQDCGGFADFTIAHTYGAPESVSLCRECAEELEEYDATSYTWTALR